MLAEVATRTQRIRFGSGILGVWGRSAATLAMAASTLGEPWYEAGAALPVLFRRPNLTPEEIDFTLGAFRP